MRSLRNSVTLLILVGSLPLLVHAQAPPKDLPTPSALIELRPVLSGVEYDTPLDQAAINACKVESVVNAEALRGVRIA